MRLYKAVITDIPAEAKINFYDLYSSLTPEKMSAEEYGYSTWDDAGNMIQDPDWKPEGWEEFLEDRAKSRTQWAIDLIEDGYTFVWPKMGGMYKSRSSAVERARRAERWGATVTIMEAEVSEFIPVEVANARRKVQAMRARADKLNAKAGLIYSQAELVATKAGIYDPLP